MIKMEKKSLSEFCKNFFKGKCVEHRKRLNLKLGMRVNWVN